MNPMSKYWKGRKRALTSLLCCWTFPVPPHHFQGGSLLCAHVMLTLASTTITAADLVEMIPNSDILHPTWLYQLDDSPSFSNLGSPQKTLWFHTPQTCLPFPLLFSVNGIIFCQLLKPETCSSSLIPLSPHLPHPTHKQVFLIPTPDTAGIYIIPSTPLHNALKKNNGECNGTPLQYSCLENPMDGGAWWAAVHGVAKGQTWLSDFTFAFHFYALEKEMATYCSVLAWRIPGMGSHRVRHDWSDLAVALAAITPSYLFLYLCRMRVLYTPSVSSEVYTSVLSIATLPNPFSSFGSLFCGK